MRPAFKRQLERALSSSVAGRFARMRITGKRLILAYHGIIPDGEESAGERALFIPQREFRAQLDFLCAATDVAPLSSLYDEGDGRPRIAITFDDAYRGAVIEGVKELAERRLPATIFVAPGRLNSHVFWWDSLSNERRTLDREVRHHALYTLAGSDERVRSWAMATEVRLDDSLPAYARTATIDELRVALRTPGITVGAHTWSHANLAALDGRELAGEIERPFAWLSTEFGDKFVPWLAYPYGLDSPESREAAKDAAYVGALRVTGGWHAEHSVSAFARPRAAIPGNVSLAGFRARVLGALPT